MGYSGWNICPSYLIAFAVFSYLNIFPSVVRSAASVHVFPREWQSCWDEERGCKIDNDGSTMTIWSQRHAVFVLPGCWILWFLSSHTIYHTRALEMWFRKYIVMLEPAIYMHDVLVLVRIVASIIRTSMLIGIISYLSLGIFCMLLEEHYHMQIYKNHWIALLCFLSFV